MHLEAMGPALGEPSCILLVLTFIHSFKALNLTLISWCSTILTPVPSSQAAKAFPLNEPGERRTKSKTQITTISKIKSLLLLSN